VDRIILNTVVKKDMITRIFGSFAKGLSLLISKRNTIGGFFVR